MKRARAGWPRPNWARVLPLLACVAFWTGAGLLVDRSAHAGQVSFEAPPARYRADTSVKVLTKSPDAISAYCHAWGVQRPDAAGCYIPALNAIAVINPCDVPDAGFIGRLLCHETGHQLGWTADHPN
ncbi:MAG: hypothetical protein P4L73_09750 [Caulobacteraceae bacterium]|nr:hypothetical protein [Caulobacteraceae bacterium]